MSATHFSKFYWSDWRADPCLRKTSLAGRGLWMEMLSIMATGPKPGYLIIAGSDELTPSDLARMVGSTTEEVEILLNELEANNVFSRDRQKKIISRRLIREAKRSRDGKKTGKLGGNPNLRKQKENSAPDNGSTNGGRSATPWPHGARPESSSQSPDTKSSSTLLPPYDVLEAKLREAAGWQNEPHPSLTIVGPILELLKAGADLELDVLAVIRAKAPSVRKRIGWRYFIDPITEAWQARVAAGGRAKPGNGATAIDHTTWTDNDYENAVFVAKRKGIWPAAYGPAEKIPLRFMDAELADIVRRSL